MKRISKALCLILVVTIIMASAPGAEAAYVGGAYISAAGAYVMDFETGIEIYSYNGDQMRVPASMTKVMSLYIMYEALENGEISLDTVVPISQRVYNLSRDYNYYNTVPLYYNQTYTVDELIDLITVYSASASVVAMAELISGTEQAFIDRMNAKAQEMGIDAHYICCSGINSNSISPRAMATLARNIITDYPEILERSSKPKVYFHGYTYTSTNLLLSSMYYEGADGLKTGTTAAAGNCFTGTAQRNGVRLITVVMNSSTGTQRYTDTHRLLDYGFAVRDEIVSNTNPEPEPDPGPEPDPNVPFIDTPSSAWYYDSVVSMWNNGIMNGTSSKTFEPNLPVTRAMAAAVIYRIAGEPPVLYDDIFRDVPQGAWYADAVICMKQYGMIDGDEDGYFRPNQEIDREELTFLIYKCAIFVGAGSYNGSYIDRYEDASEVCDWARDAVNWAIANNIINGVSDTKLQPHGLTNRAQLAVIIDRFIRLVQAAPVQ